MLDTLVDIWFLFKFFWNDSWVSYVVVIAYIFNFFCYIFWEMSAKKYMKAAGIQWSGGYDALASCNLIFIIFLPLIGGILCLFAVGTKTYD